MHQTRTGVPATNTFTFGFALLAAVLFLLSGCSAETKPATEAPPVAQTTPLYQTHQPVNNLPPPDLAAVQQAVQRVFKDAATINTEWRPAFIAGDFNGDLSQDIAVVLRPVPEKIAEMNEEYPAWILRDRLGSTRSTAPRLRIGADELLLAVIHGHSGKGWRDPEATQTYLIRNAVGLSMAAHPLKDFTSANQGRTLPHLRGDLLGETLEGRSGYLYFTGASYAWYDPRTFTAEPVARGGHGEHRIKN